MASRAPSIWILNQRKLWGDYGDVLISGYAHREMDSGVLSLHRTGPFLPPISFPWVTNLSGSSTVVSAQYKEKLETLNLPGVAFRQAIKARIIPLPWHEWNLNSHEPEEFPDNGEPENYLRELPHDTACAAAMDEAFELLAPVGSIGVTELKSPSGRYLDEFASTSSAADIPPIDLSHPTHGHIIVVDEMKSWIETQVGDWIRFLPVRCAGASRHVRE